MTLSIIIVSYNAKYFLEQCLFSVAKALSGIDAEVFIVDNHSTDGCIQYVQPKFPSFHFICNDINKGFAKANNQALAIARGKYVLFLNPDTIVAEDCFSQCIGFMETHLDAGALGVKMLDNNGRFLKESKRGFPSPKTAFWKMTGLARFYPNSPVIARYYHGNLNPASTHQVDVLSGAFMFVPKKVLDKTGGFDERFFMYAEDIDLSYRIIKEGLKNYYFPGVCILHYKGISTRKNARYIKRFYGAMSQFVEKHAEPGPARLYKIGLNLAIGLATGLHLLKNSVKGSIVSRGKIKKVLFVGNETSLNEMHQLAEYSSWLRLTDNINEAQEVIFCESKDYPVNDLLRYMEQHPGPNYSIHINGSGFPRAIL